MEPAPETRAVRLPPYEEPYRGTHQDHIAERDPGALKDPEADATGEGDVTELTEDSDNPELPAMEQEAQKTEPRVQHHPHTQEEARRRSYSGAPTRRRRR